MGFRQADAMVSPVALASRFACNGFSRDVVHASASLPVTVHCLAVRKIGKIPRQLGGEIDYRVHVKSISNHTATGLACNSRAHPRLLLSIGTPARPNRAVPRAEVHAVLLEEAATLFSSFISSSDPRVPSASTTVLVSESAPTPAWQNSEINRSLLWQVRGPPLQGDRATPGC